MTATIALEGGGLLVATLGLVIPTAVAAVKATKSAGRREEKVDRLAEAVLGTDREPGLVRSLGTVKDKADENKRIAEATASTLNGKLDALTSAARDRIALDRERHERLVEGIRDARHLAVAAKTGLAVHVTHSNAQWEVARQGLAAKGIEIPVSPSPAPGVAELLGEVAEGG